MVADYQLRVIVKEDKEDVLEFMHSVFERDEPMNASLDEGTDDFTIMDNGISIMMVDGGKVIGACINEIVDRGKTRNYKPEDIGGQCLYYVSQQARIFDIYPDCDKAMVVKFLAIHKDYRRQGLSAILLNKTRSIAKMHGCGFMTADCTSYYSSRAMEKLGFKLVYSLLYSDLKIDGKIVIKSKPPHDRINVYTQKLDRDTKGKE